jgi:hypothetical protein
MSRKRAVRNITEAGMSHAQDVHDRTVRYLVSMSIRMVCFILAVLTPSPWRWAFAFGAIVLPWVAVLIANAGKEHGPPENTSVIEHAPDAALAPGRAMPGPEAGGASGTDADGAPGDDATAAGASGAEPEDASPGGSSSEAAAGAPGQAGTSQVPKEAEGSAADDSIIEPDLDSARGSDADDNGSNDVGPKIIIGELDADGERNND